MADWIALNIPDLVHELCSAPLRRAVLSNPAV
jgi:hypothetical protein